MFGKEAPSYIAAIVAILMGGQSFVGLDFVPEQWTTFLMVLMGLIVAVRQVVTGRSTLLGGRPENFRE